MAKRKQRRNYGLRQDERGIWRCDFSVAGRRIQRSTYTSDRAQAEEWCATAAERTWREIKLGEKPSLTWEEAFALYQDDKARDGKRSVGTDEERNRVVGPELAGYMLHQFSGGPEGGKVSINAVLDDLQVRRGVSNATRNRYRELVLGVLNHCRARGYNAPAIDVMRRKEEREEPRALTRDEANALLAALPVYLRRPARYALATGARQANVMNLRWFSARYDRAGRLQPHVTEDLSLMVIPGTSAKGKKALTIPLSGEAIDVLKEARDCKKFGNARYVFTYKAGRPMAQPANTVFLRAVRDLGLEGFTWHGFRHTWTTWHLENGTPIEVVQKLGGWQSIHILLKHYAHLVTGHIARYANNAADAPPANVTQLHKVAA